jgi:GT2 family glycosyltransferase
MPEVSIIVVNYHTFQLTCDCLRSVIEKTLKVSYELILVDNGSSDQESSDFATMFPNVVYVRSSDNLGFSKGNNLGISKANGKYILLLNSDTVLINDAVSLAHQIMEDQQDVGVLSGKLLYPDGTPQAIAGVFPLLSRVVKDLFRVTRSYDKEKRAKYFMGTEWDYEKSVETDWVWGAFFMFHRSDLALFPGNKLQDEFFMYFEDVQWCFHFKRVLKKKVLYHPAPQAIHFIGQSTKTGVSETERYFRTILPNEHRWMKQTRGRLYASLYFFLKGVYYFSLRRPEDIERGRQFIRYAWK